MSPERIPLYRVRPTAGAWEVVTLAGKRVSERMPTKGDAVVHAKELARRDGSAQVIVQREDGSIESDFIHQREERGALDRDDTVASYAASAPASGRGGIPADGIACLMQRRCVREFHKTPVPDDVLERIVACAQMAPSARNRQPWAFVVVTDESTRAEIADLTLYGKHIAAAPACIAVFCDRTDKFHVEDGAAATMAILYAATALGYGACWVAGDKMPYAPLVADLLSAPPEMTLVSLVPIGRPAYVPRAERKQLEAVLHWQCFGARR